MLHIRQSMRAAGPVADGMARGLLLMGAAAMLSFAAASPAGAEDSGLTLTKAWLRMIIPSRPAAGYFTLKNDGDTARVLTGASSPACASIMLHRSKTEDGVDRMEMVKNVTVPAHGTLTFAPHGYHLMCMKPSATLKPGHDVTVTLMFKDGATVSGPFKIAGVGTQ